MSLKTDKIAKSYFVYGPQGCGKTRNADKIARALGLRRILEDWTPGQTVPATDTLILTHAQPSDTEALAIARRVLSFDAAMKRVRTMQGTQANRDPSAVRRRPQIQGARHG